MPNHLTISFPVTDSSKGYLFNTELVSSKAIQANLLLLMTTEIGTRWYLPEYGCDLRPLLFEENVDDIDTTLKNIITAAVNKFMPEITITKANYTVFPNEPNTKYADIYYTYSSDAFSESNVLRIGFKN